MPSYQVKEKSASLEMTINSARQLDWLGFAVMAIGTGIVLLPFLTFSVFPGEIPSTRGRDHDESRRRCC